MMPERLMGDEEISDRVECGTRVGEIVHWVRDRFRGGGISD